MKYVWLNLQTGEFGNSWDEESHQEHAPEYYENIDPASAWKLIRYDCLTDENFEFLDLMQLK